MRKPPLILRPPNSQRQEGNNGSRSKSKNKLQTDTRCTRDDQLNIEEFMKDDLRSINKEEEKLQRELLNMQK